MFVCGSRGPEGAYRLRWPDAMTRTTRVADRTVARLRTLERLLLGFLDPVEDALFLTAALRRAGVAASFHLGREISPAAAPAGFYAWVQCGDTVISTSLPVREEYVQVYRYPA
jgi:hypothetical protein